MRQRRWSPAPDPTPLFLLHWTNQHVARSFLPVPRLERPRPPQGSSLSSGGARENKWALSSGSGRPGRRVQQGHTESEARGESVVPPTPALWSRIPAPTCPVPLVPTSTHSPDSSPPEHWGRASQGRRLNNICSCPGPTQSCRASLPEPPSTTASNTAPGSPGRGPLQSKSPKSVVTPALGSPKKGKQEEHLGVTNTRVCVICVIKPKTKLRKRGRSLL